MPVRAAACQYRLRGHEGDIDLKIKTIEYLDNRVIKPLLDSLSSINDDVAIALLPDHPTPCRIRTHTAKPVPFVIYKPGQQADGVEQFDEEAVKCGAYGELKKDEFIKELIK